MIDSIKTRRQVLFVKGVAVVRRVREDRLIWHIRNNIHVNSALLFNITRSGLDRITEIKLNTFSHGLVLHKTVLQRGIAVYL